MSEPEIEKLLWSWIKTDSKDWFHQGLVYALVKVLQLDTLEMKGGGTVGYLPDIKEYLRKKYEPGNS